MDFFVFFKKNRMNKSNKSDDRLELAEETDIILKVVA
jgi:hypothetical protein